MAIRALTTAATGMRAQQQNIDVIANNIANVNTTGYKRSRAEFEDLLYQQLREVGATATPTTRVPTGVQVGTGVNLVAVAKIHAQGSLEQTEAKSDLAISGEGFFRVLTQDGKIAYTRAGNFHIDEQGRWVTSDGLLMDPPITMDQPDIRGFNVSTQGIVEVITSANTGAAVQVGQLQLSRFVNPAGLESIGDNLYLETPASGAAQTANPGQDGMGSTIQGFLESSNVDVVRELVNMIEGQRAYEINANSIKTADQMLQVANNLRG